MKYTVLIVDDEKGNQDLLVRTLRTQYNILTADSGIEALKVLEDNDVHLILSDHNMAEMDGLEFLKLTTKTNPNSMRILITAHADSAMLIKAINYGKIYRCVLKPWEPEALVKVLDEALEYYKNTILNQKLAQDFGSLFSGTISAITEALDAKDSYTYGRSQRVTENSLKVARHLDFSDYELTKLEIAGLLHDIGMIGVPEHILQKPDDLTKEEFEVIKNHVSYGVKIISNIKQLEPIVNIISNHHERFDGKGYPNGTIGEEIPISAKIIAVADAYDGMVSKRAYRNELPQDVALEQIQKGAGTQFDPAIVDAFLEVIKSK